MSSLLLSSLFSTGKGDSLKDSLLLEHPGLLSALSWACFHDKGSQRTPIGSNSRELIQLQTSKFQASPTESEKW